MNAKRAILLGFGTTGALALRAGLWFSRERPHAEQAGYRVAERTQGLEIRICQPTTVARTDVGGSFETARAEAYRRLASYVGGTNDHGEHIALAAPVEFERRGDGWRFAFHLPARYALSAVPVPRDERIELDQLGVRRLAVLRFGGGLTTDRAEARQQELLARLAKTRYHAIGTPAIARFEGPALPFLRRNEAWVPVALGR